MSDPAPQDQKRARAIVCEWCREGQPRRADGHHDTSGGMNRCAVKWRAEDVEAIAAAFAEQRERFDRLVAAAAMVEPLRHLVSDHDCGYSPGTRLPSERLADLAEAVAAIRSAGCPDCDSGVIHNAWGEDGVSIPCSKCQATVRREDA